MFRWPFILLLTILTVKCVTGKKRVCIIGAGVSGLVAAKYFGDYSNEFDVILFEKNSDVGGLWIYTDSTSVDEHGLPVHSSIYKSLRTNAVKEMMTLPEYPYFKGKAANGTFVDHQDVLQYLRNYTDHFNLRQFIQFNTNVINVKPLANLQWLIAAENLKTKSMIDTYCDATVICNGFDVKGYVPKIPGIESFRGQVLHSHIYRKPEPFANQTVILLGASFSGIDISVEISSVAKKVYLSHRDARIEAKFPPNLEQVPGVIAADNGETILSNGTKVRADTLILCTGYLFDFPFLNKDTGIFVEEGRYIHSIYKHLINIEHPTMAIINVPQPGLHFLVPHVQAIYFRAVLRRDLKLPSREQMLVEAQLPANASKWKAHYLSTDEFFSYYEKLVDAAGGEYMPWWYRSVYNKIGQLIRRDPINYKYKRLVINEDDRSVEFV